MDRRKFTKAIAAITAAGVTGFSFDISKVEGHGKNEIPKRTLGKTGVKVSCLIIGGVSGMMVLPTKEFDPSEMAEAALNAGINYFDTAASYNNGQSETNFGKVIARRRKEVFLSTKTSNRSYDGAMKELEASLKRLQTDHLDLWNVHGASADEDLTLWGKPDGCLSAFYKMRDEKVIRFIGVTGHADADTMNHAIDMYSFDTILTTYNPTPRRKPFKDLVLPNAIKKNMGTICMKVMGGGGGGLVLGNPSVTVGNKNWYWDETPAQAGPGELIRYALGLPVSCAVVGMKNMRELEINVAAAKMTPMTSEERIKLEEQMINAS
jgi:hypothetical protein